ncbi:tRNA 2-selenouridine(34) synthase MnmH [Runella sp.]|jgi:tRNA 2-selenouridine synthase|uniref:tRNA 2-selenouridine(34) synthase MnmH n=1 Tax=Runella sp. TaxID=1960881 RepID=UPI00262BF472|nr:tRNA 2-selenouridine(34) synthase MnmH [Runella sp.]
MAKNVLSPADFLQESQTVPVIDVRSPAEYEHAHIPNAINVPLFNNEERAQVGTCYKKLGRDAAVRLGLKLIGPKLADFVEQADQIAPNREVLVHCWRGGMRSGSFAWLLRTAGFQVQTLEGGYKAYRNHVLTAFERPQNIVIVGGHTGSGKTDILRELAVLGEQVIDLEAIAHHKGSSYGAIGQAPQPSSEQFENLLYQPWSQLDPIRRLWLEDESRHIGTCFIPLALWQQMRESSEIVFVDVPKSVRVQRLVREYAGFGKELLQQATERIKKRLGGQHYKAAIEALNCGDYTAVADISLNYYDKAYLYGISQRDASKVIRLELLDDNPQATAKWLVKQIGI